MATVEGVESLVEAEKVLQAIRRSIAEEVLAELFRPRRKLPQDLSVRELLALLAKKLNGGA